MSRGSFSWTVPGGWTVSTVQEFHQQVTLRSALRCTEYLLREGSGQLRPGHFLALELRRPFSCNVQLREATPDFWTFRDIFIRGIYQRVTRLRPNCTRIIDLGANIGLASLFLAGSYTRSSIFCVEPYGENLDMLARNLGGLQASGRCRWLQAAAWDREEWLVGACPAGEATSTTFAVREMRSGVPGPTSVQGLSMGEIIARSRFSFVDLVKVDIEGAEERLFANAAWLEHVGALAVEFHEDSRRRSDFDSVVTRAGFSIVDSGAHTVIALR